MGQPSSEQRRENARKAKEAVDKLFQGEKWKLIEDGIYLSPNRPIGAKTNFHEELRDAQILRDLGSTIYLVPESRHKRGRKYDAIVDGLQFEFKNVRGNANTFESVFLKSRSQAPNVFLNLEESDLSKREVLSALYGARNKPETANSHGYAHYNKFEGGSIILKLKGYENLLYLDVDGFSPI